MAIDPPTGRRRRGEAEPASARPHRAASTSSTPTSPRHPCSAGPGNDRSSRSTPPSRRSPRPTARCPRSSVGTSTPITTATRSASCQVSAPSTVRAPSTSRRCGSPDPPGPNWTLTTANPHLAELNVPNRRVDFLFVGDAFLRPHGAGRVLSAGLAFHQSLTGTLASDHYGLVVDIATAR